MNSPGLYPAERPVVILGAGGFAREVLGICYDLGEDARVMGFIDNASETEGQTIDGKPVLGGDDWLRLHAGRDVCALVGVGRNPLRRRLARGLDAAGVEHATVISPHALISRFARIGAGSMVCAATIVNTNVRIGEHCIVNLDCTVGHDAVLEPFVNLAPGVHVSGWVRLGEGADVGTGTAINEHVHVGAWSIVGSGSAVVRDLPANVTAVGVPCTAIKERAPGWHLL